MGVRSTRYVTIDGDTFADGAASRFDELLERTRIAFSCYNDREIAECATKSARCHLERTGNPLLREVLSKCAKFAPLGIVATHSGTCAGFLYSRDTNSVEIDRIASELRRAFRRDVFAVRTLRLLV